MSTKQEENQTAPSELENIDWAMYEWVNDLGIHAETSRGWKDVPVLWMTSERVWQIKGDQQIRDDENALILPLVTIERTDKTKSATNKGGVYAHIPENDDYRGGSITWTKRLNHQKTSNFQNARSLERNKELNFQTKKEDHSGTVVTTTVIPQIVYVSNVYTITLRAEYQQHMNQMVSPLLVETGGINHFTIRREGHVYEGFIDENFSEDNNLSNFQEEERVFKTQVDIEMLGYLIGAGKSEEQPYTVEREGPAEVSIEEEIITGSIDDALEE